MKREEEIKQQAIIYSEDSNNYVECSDDSGWSGSNDREYVEKAFIKSAKWADKTMVDKVCKWLDSINTDLYMDSGIFQMCDLIQDLKKQWRNKYGKRRNC